MSQQVVNDAALCLAAPIFFQSDIGWFGWLALASPLPQQGNNVLVKMDQFPQVLGCSDVPNKIFETTIFLKNFLNHPI